MVPTPAILTSSHILAGHAGEQGSEWDLEDFNTPHSCPETGGGDQRVKAVQADAS